MARQTERVGVQLTAGRTAVLRSLAASLGMVARAGMMKGQGSLSQMFEAIADGRLVVTWAEGQGPDSKRGGNAED